MNVPAPVPNRFLSSSLALLVVAALVSGNVGTVRADSGPHSHPCIEDAAAAAGDPTLNCTANDLGVAGLVITNPSSSEACRLDPTGTWAPAGSISVAANSNDRYDLGFYISLDGIQAQTGTCWVDIIEDDGEPGDVWADLDGDGCGDHPANEAAGLDLHDIEVPCLDSNANGFLDVILCASYDNNSNTPCNDEDEAIPGTGAKCQCLTVDSDVPVPQCETNADCPDDDDNVCTSGVCLGLGEPGTDLIGCAVVDNTLPCDDGVFCNGDDVCADGACVHAGDPCDGAGICSVCDEEAENCFGAEGTLCRPSAGVCDPEENCTDSSASCPGNTYLASTVICRAASDVCDAAEYCTGGTGACPGNVFEPAGTECFTDNDVCTDDECDGAGVCEHYDNSTRCEDGDECTVDTCDPEVGCLHELVCIDICRSPGYWSTHSGYEKSDSINIGQLLLDAAGPLEVCGQTVSETSNSGSPYLAGLGLSSSLEGLCMRTRGVKQRQLYRQLVAAALNCAASGSANDCDTVVERYVDVSFTDCSDVCAGDPPASPPSIGECVSQLGCFNNGGRMILGKCALGTCESQPGIYCGAEYGACPDYDLAPQVCERFVGNCHSTPMCNEGMEFCPKSSKASSPAACHEAKFNECTIDACD